LPVGESLPL